MSKFMSGEKIIASFTGTVVENTSSREGVIEVAIDMGNGDAEYSFIPIQFVKPVPAMPEPLGIGFATLYDSSGAKSSLKAWRIFGSTVWRTNKLDSYQNWNDFTDGYDVIDWTSIG